MKCCVKQYKGYQKSSRDPSNIKFAAYSTKNNNEIEQIQHELRRSESADMVFVNENRATVAAMLNLWRKTVKQSTTATKYNQHKTSSFHLAKTKRKRKLMKNLSSLPDFLFPFRVDSSIVFCAYVVVSFSCLFFVAFG